MARAEQTEQVATDVGFVEGPVVRGDGEVVFVSVDRGVVYRVDAAGACKVLGTTGGGPNGAVDSAEGLIYVTQNGGAWPATPAPGVSPGVQVIDRDGHVDVLCGTGMVAPNDLAFGPDGLLYVTDPTRNGLRDDGRIWRCDVRSGECELLATVSWYPNGIGFGLESDAVYVADTGARTIVRFSLDGGLSDPEVVVRMTGPAVPDGFAFDVDGNIVIACPDPEGEAGGSEIQAWTLDGEILDVLRPAPGRFLTNVAVTAACELVITDSSAGEVLRVPGWPAPGLPLHPFRDVDGLA